MLLEALGLLILGVALNYILSERGGHWRVKANNLCTRAVAMLCHLGNVFDLRRFEWLTLMSFSYTFVSAERKFLLSTFPFETSTKSSDQMPVIDHFGYFQDFSFVCFSHYSAVPTMRVSLQ